MGRKSPNYPTKKGVLTQSSPKFTAAQMKIKSRRDSENGHDLNKLKKQMSMDT